MAFKEFKELFEKTYDEILEINKIKREIDATTETINLLNSCVAKLCGPQLSYPIIVGNGLSRASISNIGTFPPYTFNKNYIYPMNYSVKKRFKPHAHYKKSINNKVLYVCTVDNSGITVVADDNYTWGGPNLWESIKRDLGITDEFSSIEDFMALSHPTVMKMIESLGDVGGLEGYVPISNRHPK